MARGKKSERRRKRKREPTRTEEDREVRDGFSNYDAVVRTPSV